MAKNQKGKASLSQKVGELKSEIRVLAKAHRELAARVRQLEEAVGLASVSGSESFDAMRRLMEHAAMVDAAVPDVVLDGRDLHAALAEQRQRADAEKGANRDS